MGNILQIQAKEEIKNNLSNDKYINVKTFINKFINDIDKEIEKPFNEIHPLLIKFQRTDEIEKFSNNINLRNKTKYINKLLRKLKITNSEFHDNYSEFIVLSHLLKRFGVDNCSFDIITEGLKNVEGKIEFENEDYYIEVKTMNEEEKIKENEEKRILIYPCNNKRVYNNLITYLKQFLENKNNIIFINLREGLEDFDDFDDELMGKKCFFTSEEGKKIGAIIVFKENNIINNKMYINKYATKKISKKLINKLFH